MYEEALQAKKKKNIILNGNLDLYKRDEYMRKNKRDFPSFQNFFKISLIKAKIMYYVAYNI